MKNHTTIIYLIGKPGVGKYTIAQELAKSGYIICDNQLANNPIFTLLNYDGFSKIPEYAWDKIAKIRTIIFDFIEQESGKNYVLTNVLNDDEGDRKLYHQVEKMADKRGSLFIPVKLSISEQEHLKRITQPTRRERWKSIDPQDIYEPAKLLDITHAHLLELDVSNLSAADAAAIILRHVKMIKS
jgi:ribosome-binding ATPase YchF (GTP1/OBG family)